MAKFKNKLLDYYVKPKFYSVDGTPYYPRVWKLLGWWWCCINCGHLFHTGKFHKNDLDEYDDVCPYCGALARYIREYFCYILSKLWRPND